MSVYTYGGESIKRSVTFANVNTQEDCMHYGGAYKFGGTTNITNTKTKMKTFILR